MWRVIIVFILVFAVTPAIASHKFYVIHGYANPKTVMEKINKTIKKEHFFTENYAYTSIVEDLDSLGLDLYQDIIKADVDTVSFVTHSMGALVFRSMLKYIVTDKKFPVIYRIVMIAPPNSGAEIADFFKSDKFTKMVLGPNVEHMRTDSSSYANELPVPYNMEIGIIIGIRGKDKGYNPFIQGDNDGLLTPERTFLGNEKDVVVLHLDHAAVTQKKSVLHLVVEFLKYGEFVSKDKYQIKLITEEEI